MSTCLYRSKSYWRSWAFLMEWCLWRLKPHRSPSKAIFSRQIVWNYVLLSFQVSLTHSKRVMKTLSSDGFVHWLPHVNTSFLFPCRTSQEVKTEAPSSSSKVSSKQQQLQQPWTPGHTSFEHAWLEYGLKHTVLCQCVISFCFEPLLLSSSVHLSCTRQSSHAFIVQSHT